MVAGNNETTIDHVTASGTTQGILAAERTGAEFTAGILTVPGIHVVTRDLANGSFETQKLSIVHDLQDAYLHHQQSTVQTLVTHTQRLMQT